MHMQICGWNALFFALEGKVNQNLEVFQYLLDTEKVDISLKDEVRKISFANLSEAPCACGVWLHI